MSILVETSIISDKKEREEKQLFFFSSHHSISPKESASQEPLMDTITVLYFLPLNLMVSNLLEQQFKTHLYILNPWLTGRMLHQSVISVSNYGFCHCLF